MTMKIFQRIRFSCLPAAMRKTEKREMEHWIRIGAQEFKPCKGMIFVKKMGKGGGERNVNEVQSDDCITKCFGSHIRFNLSKNWISNHIETYFYSNLSSRKLKTKSWMIKSQSYEKIAKIANTLKVEKKNWKPKKKKKKEPNMQRL